MAFSLRVFFLVCGISGVFGCLPGWKPSNSECYIFEPIPVSHQDAKRNCETLGAQLVTIIDPAKVDFVVDLIKNATANASNPVDTWIDLNSQVCGSSVECAYIEFPDGACNTAKCDVNKPYVCVKPM
ncbi:perlucin-like protein [Nerophis lumbriciformis]|uniref:perlucin-like protein n=1 Tax=Nerophis lumbriciformis TaxID=546530 RepID=UPI003BAB2E9F